MASARMTLGAVFATIGTAAQAVSTTIETGTKGVNMLENYVDNALEEQRERIIADKVGRVDRIMAEKAQEMAERRLSVLKFCNTSADHAEFYKQGLDELAEAFKLNERKPILSAVA